MPLNFQDIEEQDVWLGSKWEVVDEDKLSCLLARVALGQSSHVVKVLDQTGTMEPSTGISTFSGARSLLTSTQKEPFHRDGWMFQVISWIAACMQRKDELIAPPHMQHANKGFDGLHIHLDNVTGKVRTALICEDKATINPRKKITEQVWPGFLRFETGLNDNVLISNVTGLLEKAPNVVPCKAIADVLWSNARSYRIAITIGDTNNSEMGLQKLFRGYDKKVRGDLSRRRAEVLHIQDLRAWMDGIAKRSLYVLDQLEVEANV